MAKRPRDTTSDSTATSAKTASRTGRRTAPVPTIIKLHQDLEPNENHPLSGIDPARREEQRLQLFGAILARIANGPSIETSKPATIKDTEPTEDERLTANDEDDQ